LLLFPGPRFDPVIIVAVVSAPQEGFAPPFEDVDQFGGGAVIEFAAALPRIQNVPRPTPDHAPLTRADSMT
jgi:hypothetical protein